MPINALSVTIGLNKLAAVEMHDRFVQSLAQQVFYFLQRPFAQAGIAFDAIPVSIPDMKLQQFRSASKEAQEKMVKVEGVFLMERKSLGVSVLLFQVEGFYVEVFYNTAINSVSFIKSFEDMDGIEAYLERINISEVTGML